MKKCCFLLLIAIVLISIVACSSEMVTLHCDGDNCENLVEEEISNDTVPDESWIVFCQNCADTMLAD